MFEEDKKSKYILVTVLIFSFLAANIQTDIYVPGFPAMLKEFETTEGMLQLTISSNFLAVFFASLIFGPIVDAFGRKKLMIYGSAIFVIGSIGCVVASSIKQLIFWRFIQGIGCSTPIVVSAAAIFDIYSEKEASKFNAMLNSITSSCMAGAPILGNWINYMYGWRYNFILILVMVVISFLSALFFFKETLPEEKRIKINLSKIRKNFILLLSDLKFFGYNIIITLSSCALIVYSANLSLIFINHLHVNEKLFGIYHSVPITIYAIFSVMTVKLIKKFGDIKVKNIGSIICIIGALLLQIVAIYYSNSPNLITISMAIFAAGSSLSMPVYANQVIYLYPKVKGIAISLGSAIRLLITAIIIIITAKYFNGTIMPVSTTITISTICSIVLFILSTYSHRKELKT